jgi:uncharacterized protein YjdB
VLLTACYNKSCDNDPFDPTPPDPCPATGIKVTPSTLTLPELASVQLEADVTLNAKDPSICGTAFVGWSSERPSVATVTTVVGGRGDVTAVSVGNATITATVGARGEKRFSADVLVRVVALVPSIRLSANTLTLTPSQTAPVSASVLDQDNRDLTARATIVWTSNKETVATVDRTSGVITAVTNGMATITATATIGGKTVSADLALTVSDPPIRPVAALTITGPVTVRSSQTISLEAKAVDASGAAVSDPTLSWQSSAPTKAVVTRTATNAHKADVEGKLVGRVTVTVTAASGKTATQDVDVIPGPVATVLVGPADDTLRAGKSVVLTATARDVNGNNVVGQQFTWSSSSNSLATVDNTGRVNAVAAGAPTVSALATGTTITGSATVTVLPRRVGYARADQLSAASYTASAASSFNSGGGPITITHSATGIYRVSFPGLQPLAGELETFMVSGYGSNGYCKIASWGNGSGTNLDADVRCFAFGAASRADVAFTIALVSDDLLGNRFGFAVADDPFRLSYVPAMSYTRKRQPTDAITVTRRGVGKYAVTFAGDDGDNEGIIVTAMGTGGERCQAASELVDVTVLVNCWTGAPVGEYDDPIPADSKFTIVLSDRGRGFGEGAGFAFVDDVALIAQGGTRTLTTDAYNSTTNPVRARHVDKGVFEVTFSTLASGASGGRFVALVSDMDEDDSDYCSVTGWTVAGTDLVVTVTCWHEEDGTKDDDAFYLFVIQ